MTTNSDQEPDVLESESKTLRTRNIRWTAESTGLLIESRIARNKMFSVRTLANTGWLAILSDLKKGGASDKLTLNQIKKKWLNLHAKYRDIKDNNMPDIQWPYFKKMDNFLSEEYSFVKSINPGSKDNISTSTKVDVEKPSDVNLSNCRLCQEIEGVHSLTKDPDLCSRIDECTSLKILEGLEFLPCRVCNNCKTLINSFNKFLIQCRSVDKKLRESIVAIKTEKTVQSETSEVYECLECPMLLNSAEALEEHLSSHRKERRFQCDICCKNFSRHSSLCSHVKTHENITEVITEKENDKEDDSVSEIQDADFKTEEEGEEIDANNSELPNKNSDAHVGVTHRCPRQDCNKSYTTLNSLRNHERKHLGLNAFLCVSCGKGFVTKNALKCHEKIHQEVKEYVCNVCSRGFSVMSNLKTHQKKHHEGHRYYCSQCPRSFFTKCSMQRHELVHTGVKEFSCDSCTGSFYTNKELVKHKRYHQGVRSHHCNQCFKTFFEKHHLTVHMRCHTGERPYLCKLPGCGKTFRESNKLSRHMKTHH